MTSIVPECHGCVEAEEMAGWPKAYREQWNREQPFSTKPVCLCVRVSACVHECMYMHVCVRETVEVYM